MAERKKPADVNETPSSARFRMLPEHVRLEDTI